MLDSEYTNLHALIGGVLIGAASFLATAATGKIPGISATFGRLFLPTTRDRSWRLTFLIGLIAGVAVSVSVSETAAAFRPMQSLSVMAIAGVLVGLGTRIGGGCTSGHGVCGVGRGERNSILATGIFMVAAMVTVFLALHVFSLSS